MYGRLISVVVEDESSIFAFSAASFQTLQGHRVLTQVNTVLGLEGLGHVVDQHVVEVITSQVRIAVRGLHLEDAVAQLQNRDIERTAAQVVHGDLHVVLLLVQTIGQGCGRRLVDDSANLQARNLPGLLRSLTLRIGEVAGTVITASVTSWPR